MTPTTDSEPDRPPAEDASTAGGPGREETPPAGGPEPAQTPPAAGPEPGHTPPPSTEPGAAQTAAPAGPPPAAAPPRPPLRRSRTDRKIAGVAGGIARHFDVDPLLVRVLFVVLALFGGSGLLLYALGWLLIPDDGETRSEADRLINPGGSGSAVTPLVAAIIGAVGVAILLSFGPGRLALAVLVVVAVVMLIANRGRREESGGWAGPTAASAPPPGYHPPYAAAASQPPYAAAAGHSYGAPPSGPTYGPPPSGPTYGPPPGPPPYGPGPAGAYQPGRPWAPAGPAPRSPLGRITLSLAALVAGLVLAGQVGFGGDVRVAPVIAAALAVLGGGLIVGTVWGRGRWLVVPAALLALALVAAVNAPSIPASGIGERSFAPATIGDLRSPYRLGIGELQVDLRGLRLAPGQEVYVQSEVGVGHLLVLVNPGDALVLRTSVGNGVVSIDGDDRRGHDLRVNQGAPSATEGTIRLDLKVGVGQLEVRHATA